MLWLISPVVNAAIMNYIGDWKSTSTYSLGSVVTYNNTLYLSIKNSWNPPNRNKLPNQETSWWMQLVTAGNTVLNGTTAPTSTIGNVGDFYIDTAQNRIYGPKTADGWSIPVSLVGPQGIQGLTGPEGPQGPKGDTGAIGPSGPRGATGLQGIQGVRGAKGDTGATGPAGISFFEAQEGDPCTHPTSEYFNTDVLVKVIDQDEPIPGQTEYLKCDKIEYKKMNPDNNHFYYLYKENKTWDEANLACEKAYGHLATLTNQQEHDWFNLQFNSVSQLWLGGYLNDRSEWSWVTGESWNFNGWGAGQPDNSDGNEDVLMMYMHLPPDSGDWGDYANTWSLPYVCEWENSSGDKLLNPTNGHYYQKINQYITWIGAKNECERQGGYLVTITSQEENAWYLLNINQDEGLWMGATDEVVEGTWEWVTGENFNYSYWTNGEPNDMDGGQDYLRSYWGSSPTWDDDGGPRDFSVTLKFSCEWGG